MSRDPLRAASPFLRGGRPQSSWAECMRAARWPCQRCLAEDLDGWHPVLGDKNTSLQF